jgi:5'-nucleotidase
MRRTIAVLAALGLMLVVGAPQALAADGPKNKDNDTKVQLLAFNDFHGNLEPPAGSSGRIAVSSSATVDAGGVEYLATHIKQLREENSNTITVGAGDLIGASPLTSALFHDEPTIEAMNLLGLQVSGVGNHEFDEGVNELLRMQNGGCHPVDGCQDGTPFAGSLFQYLAANVFYAGTNRTILPAYEIEKVDNAKIAFIGLTLEGTPLIVTPAGVAGLEFRPEVETVNALVKKLREDEGVRAFVVLIHQGGQQNAPFANGFMDVNRCDNFSGDIKPIVDGLDPQVDLVISAHTHQPYICNFGGRYVTSASSFGRLVTDIDLTIDHQTKDVKAVTARNVIVTRDVKDPDQTALIAKYNAIAGPIKARIVGSISANITRDTSFAQETALGDVIADAQLASTAPTDFGGAVVAFMNPGGIRADLVCISAPVAFPCNVNYDQMFTVQPFSNVMTVKTMTGQQIYDLLAQQFNNPSAGALRVLQVSNGFTYSYSFTGADPSATPPVAGAGTITPGSVKIGGVVVDPLASYRVAMNNFLASGGDGFSVFNQGTDQLGGEIDIDAFVAYFEKNSPVAPGPRDRITRLP